MTGDRSWVDRVYLAASPRLVPRGEIRAFAEAIGEQHPHCHDIAVARTAGHPDLVAPPTFPIVLSMRGAQLAAEGLGLTDRVILHREQRFEHHRAVHAGDVLTATVVIDDLRTVRDLDVLVTKGEITTAAGAPVCTSITSLAVAGRRQSRAITQAETFVARPPQRVCQVSRADLLRYAEVSGDHNPIHRDPLATAGSGLPGVVAHGMLTMGLAMAEVTAETAGPAAVLACTAQFAAPIEVPAEHGADIEVHRVSATVEPAGPVTIRLLVRCDTRTAVRVTATVRHSDGVPVAL